MSMSMGWRRRLCATTALQAVATAALLAAPMQAHAQLSATARPTGGQVVAGQAGIAQSTVTTTVTQSSQRAAVNWQSFDVGGQHSVDFVQPSSSAVTLNRVVGPNPSEIAGKIQANGQIVVVNQAGLVFDKGSQVNAAGLVVSAAGISDKNFMAGKMVFDQAAKPGAMIDNQGNITVKDHGLAALVAPRVRNSGTIRATMGTVVLAGAEAETLDLYGDGLVSINVTKQVRSAPDGSKALVTNTGTIAAAGGSVVLTAEAVDGVVQTLVDAGGRISANSTAARTGRVLISGSGGDVRVDGVVSAEGTAPGRAGGTIEVSGSNRTVLTGRARISASGQAGGGTIALGTTSARAQGVGTGAAAATTKTLIVKHGATIAADATVKGNGGRVVLLSSDDTVMAGSITARGNGAGGNGGTAEISGANGFSLTGDVDLSAPGGAVGMLLIDPDTLDVVHSTSASGSLDRTAQHNANDGTTTISFTDDRPPNTLSDYQINLIGRHADVTLQATSSLTVDGTAAATGAAVVLLSHHALTLQTGTAGTIDIQPGAQLTATTVTLDGGNATLAGSVTGTTSVVLGLQGDVTQTASGQSSPTGIITTPLLTGSVGGMASLAGTNQVQTLGPIGAGTGFTLNNNTGTLTVGGAVNGGTGVALTNTGSLVIDTAVSGGTVSLGAVGISQSLAGTITADTLTGNAGAGAADFGTATNVVSNLGTFSADAGFTLKNNTGMLVVTGPVSGGLGVDLTNTGSLVIDAAVSGGTVTLAAVGISQSLAGVITAGTLTGNAGAGAADLGTATNVVTSLGTFSAEAGFALKNNTGTLTIVGPVNGGSGVELTNTGSLVIDAAINGGVISLDVLGISQSLAGIITAGTLTGDAGTGAADFGTATNVVTNLGSFGAVAGFTLKDSASTLTVTGAVNGGSRVDLTNTGSLVIDAAISGGTVSLGAVGISQSLAGIITAGTLTGDAGTGAADFGTATNVVSNLGTFIANAGFTLQNSTGTLSVIGPVNGGMGVALTNTGSLIIDAAISGGTVSLDAIGISQSLAGIITAGTLTGDAGTGAADFSTATNVVTNLGAFNADAGFTLKNDTGTLMVVGPVNGALSVDLTNTGSLVIDAAISGTGIVSLDALGISQSNVGIIIAGTLTGDAGTDAADLGTATNVVTNLGTFSAGAGFMLSNNASTLSIIGPVNGGSAVDLTNTGSLVIDAAVSGGTVTLGAVGISQLLAGIITAGTLTGDAGTGAADFGTAINVVSNLGTFSADTGFTLKNNTGTLTVAGPVNGVSGVDLTNTGSLVIDAAISGETVSLAAVGISQLGAGIITAGTLTGNAGTGAADFGTATNVVTNLGTFIANTGFALKNNTGTLTVVGPVNGGSSVDLTNTGSLVIDAAISGGTVSLAAVSISQDVAGIITAGTLAGDAGTGAADFGTATNVVANLGTFGANAGFTLKNDTGTLTVVGPVNGGSSVDLTNTGSLVIDAAISGTATVTLDALGISQSNMGIITAGTLTGDAGTGTADFGTATNVVTNLGAFSADAGFTLKNDTGTLMVVGPVNGGSSVDLTNTGSLVIYAAINGTGTVSLDALGVSQSSMGIITAGTLTGDAGAGAADFSTATNVVTNLGTFSADAGFTLNNNTSALMVVGPVNGGSGVDLTNTGSLVIDAALSGGTVSFDAIGISQSNMGIITAGTLTGDAGTGAADFGTATNAVANIGTFNADAGFTLNNSTGTLSVIGPVNGGTGVALTNAGSLVIDAAISGGTVSLDAVGISQSPAGIVTAGTFTGGAGTGAADFGTAPNNVTNLGTFSADAGFTLNNDTGTLTVVGPVSGGTNAVLTNTGSLVIDAAISGGTVSLNGLGISQDAAGIITAGTLTGDAGAGDAALDGATNMVADLGPFGAGGAFRLLDGTGLMVIAGVTAGNDATITVSGAGNALTIDAGAVVQSGTLGTVTLTASGGDIVNDGSVGGGALAMLSAANNIEQNGSVGALAISEIAGRDIDHSGISFASDGKLDLTAGNAIAQTAGSIVADNGNITLTANGTTQPFDITQAPGAVIDAVAAGSTVGLTAATGIAFGGTISSMSGTIVLTAQGGDITETQGGAQTGTLIAQTLTGSATGQAALDAPSPTGTSNQVAELGPFTTGGSFTLVDGHALAVTAVVTAGDDAAIVVNGTGNSLTIDMGVTVQSGAGGTASVTASGGNLVNDGTLSGGVLAALTAGGDIDQSGLVTAAAVTATAGHDIDQNGVVDATSGNASLLAGNDITQSGTVTAGANATLTATAGTLTQNGTVTGGGSDMLTAGTDLLQTGTVIATNGNATLTAGGDLTQNGIVSAGADATLTAIAGMLTQNGTVTGGGSDMLTAGTDLLQNGTVIATAGDATLTAGGSLMQASIVSAGSNVVLTATAGTLTQSGTVTGGGSDTLTAGTDLLQNGTVIATTGSATLTAGGNLTQGGTVTAGADANLTATAGMLTQTGTVTAGNAAMLTAGSDLLQNGTVIATNGNAMLTAGNSLTQRGIVTAGADATLTATAGTLTQNGRVSAGSSDTLTAGSDLFQNGTVIATNGDATLTAGGNLTQASIVTAGSNVELAATGGMLTQSGTVTAGGSAMLSAGADLLQNGNVTAMNGNATLTAAGNLTQGGFVTAGADVTLTATTGTLTQNGNVTAGDTDTLTAGADLFQNGTVIATNGNATLTAGGNLTQGSIVTAGTDATLTAKTGTLTQNGNVTAGDTDTLTAGADLFQNGTVIATNGNATLTAGGNLTQGSIVTAGTDATLTATAGTLTQIGNVTAGGSDTLTAGADLLQTGSVIATTGNVTLTAGGNLTQGGVVSAGADAALTATAGTLTQESSVTAGNSAMLAAGADLLQTGTVIATNGNATLTAGGNLTQAGLIIAGNSDMLTAGATLLQNGSVIATDGNATLTAGGSLTQGGIVTAGSNADLTATGGTLTQNGTVTSGSSDTLTAGVDLIQNGAVIATNGNATLTAGGNLTQDSIVSASADVTMTATAGTLTQNGIVTAGNTDTLTAGADLFQDGTVIATAGNAILTAGDSLTQGGIVTAGTNAALTTINGTLNQNGSVTAAHDATLIAGASLFQKGVVIATGGDATLTAANDLTQASIVTAGSNAALTATNGTLNQNGTVTAGTSATLTAGADLFQTGAVHATNSNATLTAGDNLTQSGIVTAGSNATLTATTGALDQSGIVTAGNAATFVAGGALMQMGTVRAAGGNASLTAGSSLMQSNIVTANGSAIFQALGGNLTDSGIVTAPNIQLAARNGTVTLTGTLAGVRPDPTLNPQFKLAQGAFPSNPAIGAWIIGGNIVVAPSVLVTGAGGGTSELVVVLTNPHGLVSFGNFNNQSTDLYLNLGTGLAAGQLEVKALQVQYTQPGTTQTINLMGTVDEQSGSTAASASFIQPQRKDNYQVNGCPIGSANCVRITTLTLPVINPLKDLEVSTPDQPDDILIILPDVGDRDY